MLYVCDVLYAVLYVQSAHLLSYIINMNEEYMIISNCLKCYHILCNIQIVVSVYTRI